MIEYYSVHESLKVFQLFMDKVSVQPFHAMSDVLVEGLHPRTK